MVGFCCQFEPFYSIIFLNIYNINFFTPIVENEDGETLNCGHSIYNKKGENKEIALCTWANVSMSEAPEWLNVRYRFRIRPLQDNAI